MPETTNSPAFPEGSTVRDRQTGLEYTATGETIPGNGKPVYWAMVTGADGVERQLPACDLEPVENGRISSPTVPEGFTLTHMEDGFLDAKGPTRSQDDCTIECIWSSDKGHQFFFDRRTDEPFTLDELDRLAELLKGIVNEYGSNGTGTGAL